MVKEHLQPSRFVQLLVLFFMILLAAAGAKAQHVTGTPGSPSATTTIDGKQVPPPLPKLGGVIKENAKHLHWWPPRVMPPMGAPSVLLPSAPGNNAPIGGLKVVANSGWFAARPSGTDNINKIYAESFRSRQHLDAAIAEAQKIVNNALGSSEGDPQLGVRQ
jgi:phosphomannomutase